jgi:hypothetical protein
LLTGYGQVQGTGEKPAAVVTGIGDDHLSVTTQIATY